MIFPVALSIVGRSCLVVGTGVEATQRVQQLVDAGAHVHWVTTATPVTSQAAKISIRPFETSDLADCWLVILADFDTELARQIGSACQTAQKFFCAVDQPELNTFSHMALINAPPVTLALSTSGRLPALARRLQQLLRPLFTPQILAYFAQVAEQRDALPSGDERRKTLTALLSVLELNGSLSIRGPESQTIESESDDTAAKRHT
jgi:precorrin-2 dehydrogenase / sirohydrochlorin ferrochelatase